jgi:hypothetical protein
VDSFFSKVFASLPIRPSAETTNGVKVRRCSRQVFLLLFFVDFQDLGGVFGEIALGVGICDTDINKLSSGYYICLQFFWGVAALSFLDGVVPDFQMLFR